MISLRTLARLNPLRSSNHTAQRPKRRAARPVIESLEERQVLSFAWGQVPTSIKLPTTAITNSFTSNELDTHGTLTTSNISYNTFIAPRTGTYGFTMTATSAGLAPTFGVYAQAGNRLNGAWGTSSATCQVNLIQGHEYILERAIVTGSSPGSYSMTVAAPSYYTGEVNSANTYGEAYLVGNTLTLHMTKAFSRGATEKNAHQISVQLIGNDGRSLTTGSYTSDTLYTGGTFVFGVAQSLSDRYWTFDVSNINMSNFNHLSISVS